jgi:hypothetical protein
LKQVAERYADGAATPAAAWAIYRGL